MKLIGIDSWNSPNTYATNESSFFALPGGYRNNIGSFLDNRASAYFWSATGYATSGAFYRYLDYANGEVGRFGAIKLVGASVRCLKD